MNLWDYTCDKWGYTCLTGKGQQRQKWLWLEYYPINPTNSITNLQYDGYVYRIIKKNMVGFLHTANILKKCHIFLQLFSQWEIHYDWGIDLGHFFGWGPEANPWDYRKMMRHLDRGFAEDDL